MNTRTNISLAGWSYTEGRLGHLQPVCLLMSEPAAIVIVREPGLGFDNKGKTMG